MTTEQILERKMVQELAINWLTSNLICNRLEQKEDRESGLLLSHGGGSCQRGKEVMTTGDPGPQGRVTQDSDCGEELGTWLTALEAAS